MSEIGAFLKQARDRKGMSLRGAAERIGTSFTHLQRIESGQHSPSVDTLTKICAVLDIEPWEALAGFTKADLIREILGPVPFDDPAVREILQLAAQPNGLDEIRDLLALARETPGKVAGVMRILRTLRETGMLK